MFKPIHKHLIIKADVEYTITEPAEGKMLLLEVVAEADMTPVTQPQAVYVPEAGNEGLTGSINLATSHAAFHIWDKKKLLMFDLYSCKYFDEEKVIKLLTTYFGKMKIEAVVLDRDTMAQMLFGGEYK